VLQKNKHGSFPKRDLSNCKYNFFFKHYLQATMVLFTLKHIVVSCKKASGTPFATKD
jgi:hypothetical protein